jgi:hypothetical protein
MEETMRNVLVLGLLLAVVGCIPASGEPFPRVEVLVQGTPLPVWHCSGTTYVEALKGREYAVRISNPTGGRVAVALSVDGLNTIDARHTDARNARKWVLGPYESVVISGWQTNQSQARRFFFTSEERSYGAWLGKTENLGIISAVFFREKAYLVERPSVGPRASGKDERLGGAAPAESQSARHKDAGAAKAENEDYAATGIGRRVDHEVQLVQMQLEENTFDTVNLRYEFRPALVKLGVIPPDAAADPLTRREHARGFRDSAYCPEP